MSRVFIGSAARRLFVTAAAMHFFAFTAPAAAEQPLSGAAARIERHDRRQTRHAFKTSPLPLGVGLLFQPSWEEALENRDQRLISYEALPVCSNAEYMLQPIVELRPESWLMDIVYYSGEDRAQQLAAKRHKGITVAYEPALVRRPGSGLPNYLQAYARFLRIECLPTRFRYVEIDGRRYREITTGAKAWSSETGEPGGEMPHKR